MTTFYIVRHGETEWNVQGLMQGHTDSPLTETGLKQAQKLAKELRHIHFDSAFSSDLLRAKRTAEIIALEKEIAVQATKKLRERHFGKYEGRPLEEFRALFGRWQELRYKERLKEKPSEDAESIEEVISRTITFIRETAIAFPEQTILLVSHGGVMRNLMHHLGYWHYKRKEKFGNTGYIVLESDGVDFFLKKVKGTVAYAY